MNRKTLMLIGVAFILVIAGVLLYFALRDKEVEPVPVDRIVFPGDEIHVLSNGTVLTVPNFTKEEQPVWIGPNEYQVEGSPYETYLITYLKADEQENPALFLVTLLAEPLGATRSAAEEALLMKLRINRQDLCGLNAIVSAGPGVNERYAPDQNLGFSGCPGSVYLP